VFSWINRINSFDSPPALQDEACDIVEVDDDTAPAAK
jgi:hypothetical protein